MQWTAWPERPERPLQHSRNSQKFSVLRIPQVTRSPAGRSAVREILTTLFSEWADTPVSLKETDRGPVLLQKINGRRCFFSISYSGGSAWVAAAFDTEIGIDAVEIEAFEQLTDVERLYLAPCTDDGSFAPADKCLQFARRWSAMEARFKRAGLPLKEGTVPPAADVRYLLQGRTVVAVALH